MDVRCFGVDTGLGADRTTLIEQRRMKWDAITPEENSAASFLERAYFRKEY